MPEKTIERVVEVIGSFALYGFPESHAISFGILAYASSYLKVHRAAEFYTGLLNNQPMGFYSPATLIQEAKRRGLRFESPCIATSGWRCEILDDRTIRMGLKMVKGLQEEQVVAMIEERDREPFRSLADFRRRTKFDRRQVRQLATVGAFQEYASTRRRAIWEVEEAELEQGDLFAEMGKEDSPPHVADPDSLSRLSRTSPLPEMSYHERIQADFSGMGMTAGKHPMALVRARLLPGILQASALAGCVPGASVATAGAVICRQRPGTAKGVVFITLEDETGLSNSIVYAECFEEYRLTITTEPFLVVHGTIQQAEGTTHVMAERIEPLRVGETLPAGASHDFH